MRSVANCGSMGGSKKQQCPPRLGNQKTVRTNHGKILQVCGPKSLGIRAVLENLDNLAGDPAQSEHVGIGKRLQPHYKRQGCQHLKLSLTCGSDGGGLLGLGTVVGGSWGILNFLSMEQTEVHITDHNSIQLWPVGGQSSLNLKKAPYKDTASFPPCAGGESVC